MSVNYKMKQARNQSMTNNNQPANLDNEERSEEMMPPIHTLKFKEKSKEKKKRELKSNLDQLKKMNKKI